MRSQVLLVWVVYLAALALAVKANGIVCTTLFREMASCSIVEFRLLLFDSEISLISTE